LAATTGLLLVYGITFALEGMTTRVPTSAIRELAIESLCTVPWVLLFCSGLHDLVVATKSQWVLWVGGIAALLFLYYFDHYTSLSFLTKAAMPPITLGLGLIPHFVKKVSFLFAVASLASGIAAVFVLYYVAATFLSPTTHFVTPAIAALLVAFCASGITSGVLVILEIYRGVAHRFA
jgi:hypothetical protein